MGYFRIVQNNCTVQSYENVIVKLMVCNGFKFEIPPVVHSLAAATTAKCNHFSSPKPRAQRALRLAAASLYRQAATTVEPTKEKATIKMDGCIDSDRVVSSTKKKIHRNMKTVDSTSCWLAFLYIIVSLFGLYPPITELPIDGSLDLHIRQQLVNSGNPRFQLEEPIRYSRFEWGRRCVPNASLSLVPSLSPNSNLS